MERAACASLGLTSKTRAKVAAEAREARRLSIPEMLALLMVPLGLLLREGAG